MAPRTNARTNLPAKVKSAVTAEIRYNKLTKLLVASCSSDKSAVHDLCMFFKLVALHRCRLELNKNVEKCQQRRKLVIDCVLDLVAPGTSGRISQNLITELPRQYYGLAMSALLSCDIDLHIDVDDLHDDDLSFLMLILRSPLAKLRASQINVPFGIILNHLSRLYADDDDFYKYLMHRDARGRNVMHYMAETLNTECLAELSAVIATRQSSNRRKILQEGFGDEYIGNSYLSLHFANLLSVLASEPDENGETPLFYAVRKGPRRARDNINFIDELASFGASLTHLNKAEQSLLMLALKTNKPYLVRYLIQKIASIYKFSGSLDDRCERIINFVMAKDAEKLCSFHYAVRANSIECARELALGIVLYGIGKKDRTVGTTSFLTDVGNRFHEWYKAVRADVLGQTVFGRNGGKKFERSWGHQHFIDFLDILRGNFAHATISHDISHEHTDARSYVQHSAIKAVNEVDDVMYPEQIKYEDRDLFPILAADAVRNVKRDKNSKLAAYCCDCKGTCVFGYCPCMNAIDYDAYNEHGRCRMLAKVRSDIYHWCGAFRYEGDGASPDETPPNDPTKLGRSTAAVSRSNSRRRTMTSAGNSRRANLSVNDDDDMNSNAVSAAGKPTERRSIILPPLIVECGEMCQCARNLCRNRVTQNSTRLPRLEVFRSRKCGWGVRTLDPIKPGQIICTMSGLLTRSENVDDPMYCMSLIDLLRTGPNGERIDERDLPKDDNELNRQFNLDSKDFGNVGRFLNHSCSPNCATTAILHDQHDLRTPKITLFAMKSIHVLSELTWFYSMNYWSGNGDYGTCKCGASNCQWRNKNKENDDADANGGGAQRNRGRKPGGNNNVRSKILKLPPMSPSAVSDGGTIVDNERYRSVSVEEPRIDLDVLRRHYVHTRRSDSNEPANDCDGCFVGDDAAAAAEDVALREESPESPPNVHETSHYLLGSSGKRLRKDDPKAIEIALDVEKYLRKKPHSSTEPAEYYRGRVYESKVKAAEDKADKRRIERRWFYETLDENGLPVAVAADDADTMQDDY